jgi:uncharacterized membrane protein
MRMELLVLLLLAGLFALFVAHQSLRQRVTWLERRLDHQLGGPAAAPEPEPEPAPAAAETVPYAVGYTPPPATREPAPAEAEAEAEEYETLGGLFERLVGGSLLIWIGGVALAIAGIFLIRYSVGLFTPEVRMIAAAILGLIFVGAGEYARAGRLADDPRIAQALVGSGLAVLYATAYGSHILYGLIGTGAASAAMLAVSAAALVLSLRHGAPTAMMGLAGGFLTPLLVGDPDAGAVPLLAYLALLDTALFAIAWRRGWTWLAAAAVALSFFWTAWLLTRPEADALAAGVFVVLLAVAASLARPGRGRELGLIQPLAIGIVQLAVLVARVDLGLSAWILFGALAAASLALAALRPAHRLAPPLALALALALLFAKSMTGEDPVVPAAAIGITLIFGAGGLGLRLWQKERLWTAVACAGFVGPALIVRAARPELLERPGWGALMLALALGPAALAWLDRERAAAEPPADLALLAAGATAALLAGAAAWDLLPAPWVGSGWLVVALLAALAARRLGDLALATVTTIAAAVAVARCVWTVPELSAAALTAAIGDPVLAPDLPSALAALRSLAVPALLLVGLRLLLPALPLGARRALPVAAGLFAAAALYVWFKQAFGLADERDFVARGMLERTLITQALFVLGWLLGAGVIRPRGSSAWLRTGVEPDLLRLGGTLLTAFAAVRLIWLDIIVHNPATWEQWVGPLPVFNLILPAYLLSAVWLYLARRRADQATRSGFWLGAFFAALVTGTMLLVRQAFQGPILTGTGTPLAEFYGYSLAGLILSIGLLLAGIRLPDKALRLAGLILLTATILKVFLIDASELEGIWRILSFLGLGVALIGIGRLYGPVLRAERAG